MEDDTLAQPAYTALFVFGDSLSDNGAVFALTEGALPPTELIGIDLDGNPVDFTERGIFYNGRYTNGDVYADVAAHALGIPGDTSTFYDDFSGSSLAIGGRRRAISPRSATVPRTHSPTRCPPSRARSPACRARMRPSRHSCPVRRPRFSSG